MISKENLVKSKLQHLDSLIINSQCLFIYLLFMLPFNNCNGLGTLDIVFGEVDR